MRIDETTERTADGRLVPTPGQTIGPFFGYANGYEQVHLPWRDGHQLVAVAPRQVDLLVAVRVAEERADGLARGGDQPPVGGALGGLVDPHQ